MSLLSFQDLSFSYGSIEVLKNVNLEVHQGEYIGIIGPNGGGKTTALQLILGFLKPRKGMVHLECPSTKIGYVPQINAYDKAFPISVLEVVLMGSLGKLSWMGTLPKEEKERARLLLKEVGCAHLEKRAFGTLSGGQAQKVLIARALMCDPELLLLDEPTANIDAESEGAIFAYLKTLQGKKTIMIVTHNFDAIVKNVERVICFQQEVSSMKPQEVCKHFTIGMYHG
ncbi:MAG: ATP-binding cassette domain-containing protein [Chlamydiia bacterium]|nr:ATP-binding cassette domain-containing protein [Chlamydiia bacterium]MCP5505385.1 ATP-binding cassette domain-containing protein [Chlamydiales bacterium]